MSENIIKNKKPINTRVLISQTVVIISLIILVLFTFIPLLLTVMLSLKPSVEYATAETLWKFPSQLLFDNYLLGFPKVLPNMFITLYIDLLSLVVTIFISSFVAYIFAKKNFMFKEILFIFVIIPMMVPSVITLTPAYLNIVNLGLKGNHFGLILPYIAGNQIAAIFLFRIFISQHPQDVYEAARVDGANDIITYFLITLPLALGIIIIQAVGVFVAIYNDYMWPLLILDNPKNSTLMPVLQTLSLTVVWETGRRGAQYAVYILSGIPLVISVALSMKYFINADFAAGMKL